MLNMPKVPFHKEKVITYLYIDIMEEPNSLLIIEIKGEKHEGEIRHH